MVDNLALKTEDMSNNIELMCAFKLQVENLMKELRELKKNKIDKKRKLILSTNHLISFSKFSNFQKIEESDLNTLIKRLKKMVKENDASNVLKQWEMMEGIHTDEILVCYDLFERIVNIYVKIVGMSIS